VSNETKKNSAPSEEYREPPAIDGIREFQWPFRNPLDLVAELFCACRWQINEEAGDFAAKYLFGELRLRLGQDEARKIFLQVAGEESATADEHDIEMLIARMHLMRDKTTGKRKPNVQALARLIAAEHDAFNKSPDRNGRPARPTHRPTIEKQIIRIRDANEAGWLAAWGLPPRPPKKKKI
jgi:hypothetical protein